MLSRTEPFGIDVSSHNEKVDMGLVKSFVPKIQFCIGRIGMSWGYEDPCFKTFRAQFESAGILFEGYHVIYPGEDIARQVAKIINVAGTQLPRYWIDDELIHGCTPTQKLKAFDTMARMLMDRGLKVGGYTSPGWANQYLIPSPLVPPLSFSQIDWWLAQYLLIQGEGNEHPGPLMKMRGVSKVLIHQTTSTIPGELLGQPWGSSEIDGNRWLIGSPITTPPVPVVKKWYEMTTGERLELLKSKHPEIV